MASDKILWSSIQRNMRKASAGARKFAALCTIGSGSETFAIIQGGNFHGDYDQESYDKEVAMLRRLQGHPNVVRFVAEVDSEGILTDSKETRYSWLLEYLPVSLDQFVSQSPPPSYAQRCWVALQIVRGVAFMHSKHVIHRDIKPDNVLLDSLEKLNVKIIDFDMAVMDDAGVLFDWFGSKPYMPPENFGYRDASSRIGQKPAPKLLTSAADVWSLGLVLVHVFTGKRDEELWGSSVILANLDNLLVDERGLPEALKEMSGDPLRLVQQCLRYDDRISSAELLAQAELCLGMYDPSASKVTESKTPALELTPVTAVSPPVVTTDAARETCGSSGDAGELCRDAEDVALKRIGALHCASLVPVVLAIAAGLSFTHDTSGGLQLALVAIGLSVVVVLFREF